MDNGTIVVRVDSEVKQKAQDVLQNIGLDFTSAINLFLLEVVSNQELQFQLKHDVAKARIQKAMNSGTRTFDNVDDLMDELDNA